MAKHEKVILEPEKEKAVIGSETEKVTVELLKGHPHFNSKLKRQNRFKVTQKLADKGVKSGHWKIVE